MMFVNNFQARRTKQKIDQHKKGRTPFMRKLVHLVTKLTRIAQCKTHHKTKLMQFEV
jgi:hypothetical protein